MGFLLAVTLNDIWPYMLGSVLLTAVVTAYATRKKTAADAGLSDANSAKILVDTATDLTNQMREENERMRAERDQDARQLEALESRMKKQSHENHDEMAGLRTRLLDRDQKLSICMQRNAELQQRLDDLQAPGRNKRDPNG